MSLDNQGTRPSRWCAYGIMISQFSQSTRTLLLRRLHAPRLRVTFSNRQLFKINPGHSVIVKGRSPSFRQSFYKRSLRGYSRAFYEMSRHPLVILLFRFVSINTWQRSNFNSFTFPEWIWKLLYDVINLWMFIIDGQLIDYRQPFL